MSDCVCKGTTNLPDWGGKESRVRCMQEQVGWMWQPPCCFCQVDRLVAVSLRHQVQCSVL